MTMPPLPQQGYPRPGHPEDPSWTSWAQALHDAAEAVTEGRLTEAELRAASVAAAAEDIVDDTTGLGGAAVEAFGAALPGLIDTTPVTAADFGLAVPEGVRAYANATAQTIASGAYPVYLDLNTTDFNENTDLFTVDLTNNRLYVNEGGPVLVNWGVKFAAPPNLTDIRDTYLTKNGGNALDVAVPGVSGQARGFSLLRLNAGDYVQIICFVEGATVAIESALPHQSFLSLHRIGL